MVQLFFILIFYFVISIIYSFYKIFFIAGDNFYFFIIYLFIFLINLFILLIVFYKKIFLNIILLTYLLVISSLYSYEVYLIYKPLTIWEEYERLTDKKITIVPHVRKKYFSRNNKEIYVLGGVSNSKQVLNNENGYYPLVELDEFGWNNSKNNYNNVEIVLIGGSFAEGFAVDQEQNIASLLRKQNLNSVSFGKAGLSPFHMLAVFKEYITYFKPKYVLWFYSNYDIYEMQESLNDQYLLQYLQDEEFFQNLIERQEEIDSELSNYTFKEWDKEKITRVRKYINIEKNRNIYTRTLKLTELREKLKFHKTIISNQNTIDEVKLDKNLVLNYEAIIKKVNEGINKWGGKLHFVYIPTRSTFDKKSIYSNFLLEREIKEKIFNIIKANKINIIDLESEIIKEYSNPLKLYSIHFKPEGYEFVANKIAKHIK